MVANLTPQYQKAEEEYRKAQSALERQSILEKLLQLIPKHKGTEKLQADLKTKLKESREEFVAEKAAAKQVVRGVKIPRQGAAQVILVGGPNAGKSRILRELTKAQPDVQPYPFTTREPLPGMMTWEDVTVQLIDTPPVTDSQFDPSLLNMVRPADLVVLAMDGSSDDAPEATVEVINQFRQRATELARTTGFDEDDFSKLNVRTLLVVTRAKANGLADRLDFYRELSPPELPRIDVDLDDPADVAALRERIWRELHLVRVYTKTPGKPAVYEAPFSLPSGATVEDLAGKVHRDLVEKLRSAKVWPKGSKDMQTVGRDHPLREGDMVELQTA